MKPGNWANPTHSSWQTQPTGLWDASAGQRTWLRRCSISPVTPLRSSPVPPWWSTAAGWQAAEVRYFREAIQVATRTKSALGRTAVEQAVLGQVQTFRILSQHLLFQAGAPTRNTETRIFK